MPQIFIRIFIEVELWMLLSLFLIYSVTWNYLRVWLLESKFMGCLANVRDIYFFGYYFIIDILFY